MISDKQRDKHVYPVLKILSNKIKLLQVQKCKLENLIEKS